MEIPKYVEKLIDRRAELAFALMNADYKLSNWLDKNYIDVDDEYIHGGCEMYINPWITADAVRRAIHRSEGRR